MNETTLDRNRIVCLFLLLGVLLFPTSSVFAIPSGISGFSGASGSDCTACHDPGAPVPTLALIAESESTIVSRDSVTGYVLIMVGGPAGTAGLDVAASGGSLIDTNAAGTRILNGELTHTSPNSMSGGTITWTFDWLAPSIDGTYFLDAAALSADGTGGAGGDGTETTTLALQVVPEPSASLLVETALVVLVWLRGRRLRRPADK